MSSSPKVVVLVRPSRCRWVCSDSCYCPVSWWYLATDFIRLNASAALSVVITTGCRAGQSETRERVVKKGKARSTQCRHAKPYYPGPTFGMARLDESEKERKVRRWPLWEEGMHLSAAPAGTVLRCSLATDGASVAAGLRCPVPGQ